MAKILIAEDERDIRELIAFTLQFAGYQVISTNNGEEAFETAKYEIPDLILLDIRMPRMTGYEACSHLKAELSTKHIPVIFLSAKGQEAEVQTGLDLGATDYIVKPFSPDQLVNRIQAALMN
jgi:two-component system alkaline phosphatase synthesis response regulator PhoP